MKRKALTSQEKAAMKALYLDDKLSNIDIARKFNVKPNTVPGVARAEGWPMREERRMRSKHKRSFAKVFLGRDGPRVPPTALDEAKNVLRRRGCIVFDATVTDGTAGEGLIKCDRLVVTPEQLLEMAKGLPAR